MIKKWAGFATALLVAWMLAASAAASPPVMDEWSDSEIAYAFDCGDYIQIEEHFLSVREMWQFDEFGYPVFLKWQLTGEIRLYDENFPDDYVAGTARTHQFAHWEDGVFQGFTINGIRYHFVLPGLGMVFIWAGRFEFDENFIRTNYHGTIRNELSDEEWCALTRH